MTTSDPQGVTPEDLTPEGAGPEPAGADQGAGAAGGNAGTPPQGGSPKHTYYEGGAGASAEPGGDDEYDHAPDRDEAPSQHEGAALAEEDTMAATLLADLQRLQAEYVNYKKRVDRDRDVIRHAAVESYEIEYRVLEQAVELMAYDTARDALRAGAAAS